jgi:hypothetical protein
MVAVMVLEGPAAGPSPSVERRVVLDETALAARTLEVTAVDVLEALDRKAAVSILTRGPSHVVSGAAVSREVLG